MAALRLPLRALLPLALTRPFAAAAAAAAATRPLPTPTPSSSPPAAGTTPVTLEALGPTTTLVRSAHGFEPAPLPAAQPLAPVQRAFAVVEVASKQFKVAADDVIIVNKLKGTDIGQTLQLDRVLLAGGHDFTLIGRPYVDPARVRVSATVIEEARAAKVIAFKFRRRKNSKRTRGHRQEITVLRISQIAVDVPRPA